MSFKIKNSIPRWIIATWLAIGIIMLLAWIGWNLLDLIDRQTCLSELSCAVFNLIMFFMNFFGVSILVLGILILLGNESGTK
jgi:hypothetical protein